MSAPNITIAGAGIIGLSLALELEQRGTAVTVFDSGPALAEASTAAAGMLAAHDPENPPQLQPLANLSLQLYPAFLARIAEISGTTVPFETTCTIQYTRARQLHLAENSLNPRTLATALLAAIRNTTIKLHEHTPAPKPTGIFIDSTGAWAISGLPVRPIKGQLLSVELPPTLTLPCVIRTPGIYIVPRLNRTAIIGSTHEDAGFDKSTNAKAIATLHQKAAAIVPQLAEARILSQWAGLRPATPDQLPLIGPHPTLPSHYLATGHFRNGILLAPATACVLADLILNPRSAIDLTPFAPARFSPHQ